MSKPSLLIFIDWFKPAYKAGGPIRSVSAIVDLISRKFEVFIITSNCDLNQEILDLKYDVWIEKADYNIIYCSKAEYSNQFIRNEIKRISPSLFYFNSLFSFNYTLKPLWLLNGNEKTKAIVAPRGMLGEGAIENKKFKKTFFLKVSKWLGLFNHVGWHATSQEEANEIRFWFGDNLKPKLARNLTNIPQVKIHKSKKKEGQLKLIFFSRISNKKNTHFALEVITRFKSQVTLDIYGPIDDNEYWERCLSIIKKESLQVRYKRILQQFELDTIIPNYDFLLFPTLHENFGHVVIESLLRGLPVIVSNRTYWEYLQKNNAGYDLPLEKDKFEDCIKECIEMSSDTHQSFKEGALQFGLNYVNDSELIKETFNLFGIEGS